ncbi:DbpA RNA binding domain-containing protein, partial [Methylophaga sp. UBA4502]
PIEIAAALAFLVQKDRPLKPVKHVTQRPAREERERGPRQERGERPARGSREDRPPREKRAPRPHPNEPDMDTYRVEVGRADKIEPRNLVGAIANESGIESQFIGRITINEDHSLIDLPQGMPKDMFQQIRKVWVNNKQLNMSLATDEAVAESAAARPSRRNFSKDR